MSSRGAGLGMGRESGGGLGMGAAGRDRAAGFGGSMGSRDSGLGSGLGADLFAERGAGIGSMASGLGGALGGGMGGIPGMGSFDDEKGEEEKKQPQLTEGQTKALLSELSPKLREELCKVLQAQQQQKDGKTSEDPPMMSRELARVLQRFQRRVGLGANGFDSSADEAWPMYLGIALFFIIFGLLVFFWLQEQYAEEDLSDQEDFYWMLREW